MGHSITAERAAGALTVAAAVASSGVAVAVPGIGAGLGGAALLAIGLRVTRGFHVGQHLIVVAAIVVALNAYAPAEPSAALRISASALLTLCAIPAIAWARRPTGLPFVQVVCFAIAVGYAIPIFVRPYPGVTGPLEAGHGALLVAVWLAIGGTAAMLLGFACARRRDQRVATAHQALSPATATSLCVIGLMASVVTYTVEIPAQFQQLLSLVDSLTILGVAALAVNLTGRREFAAYVVVGAVVAARLAIGLTLAPILLLFPTVEVLVPLVLAVAWAQKRIAWAAMFLGVALLFPIQIVKTELRVNAEQTGTAAINVLGGSFGTAQQRQEEQERDRSLARFDQVSVLAVTVEQTPLRVPYWGGYSFRTAPSKLIPRILLPSKPLEDTGQAFGHRYGFLAENDFETSINLPHVVDFFINFGWGGVLLGMFAVGIGYRALLTKSLRHRTGVVLAIYVMTPLILIEGSVISVLSGAVFRYIFGRVVLAMLHSNGTATASVDS